jgi:CBS domain-containing protein
VVEKSGQYKNQLDLKRNGLIPLVDAVRTLSLDQKIFETNMLDRILALAEKRVLTQRESEDLHDAFNVIMLMRVRHHVNMMNREERLDNYINPDGLSIIQRTMLKESFKSIDRLQNLLKWRYSLEGTL